MNQEEQKRLAARAALELLPPHGILGLGTGSTVHHFILGVGEQVKAGHDYVGVATSDRSRKLAASLGIPLLEDEGPWEIAVCVDGADEVSAEFDLIKGGGGAHAREKIVNYATRKNIIVVDESKLSPKLGERAAVPIEVLPFAHRQTAHRIGKHGKAQLRMQGAAPVRTDSGNYIYDLATGRIEDPCALDVALKMIPGVVETGLFCGRADIVLVARGGRVDKLER